VAEPQVTAPDQHRPLNRKWVRIGGVVAILTLLSMTQPFNNHTDWVADAFLVLVAGVIAVALVADAALRRRGLRR
jgi:hypothetical protein